MLAPRRRTERWTGFGVGVSFFPFFSRILLPIPVPCCIILICSFIPLSSTYFHLSLALSSGRDVAVPNPIRQ